MDSKWAVADSAEIAPRSDSPNTSTRRREPGLGERRDRTFDVVRRASELDVRVEKRPERSRLALIGKPDAAGIHEPRSVRHAAVELDVRVPAHDDVGVNPRERRGDLVVRGEARQVLFVGVRRGVAEDDMPQIVDVELHGRGPRGDERHLVGCELLSAPARALADGADDLALAVAGEEARADGSQAPSGTRTGAGPRERRLRRRSRRRSASRPPPSTASSAGRLP